MRQILLVFCSVFFLLPCLKSQQYSADIKKVSAGLKSGLNVTHLKLNGKIPGLVKSDYRTGFVAGAYLNFPLKKVPLSFQPEFLYSSMGGDLKKELNENQNLRFNNFSFPILIKYHFSEKLSAFAGPQADIIIYGKETNIFGDFNITNDVEDIDALVTGGMEWVFSKNAMLNARYMHGFKKVYYTAPEISMNNRGFQITLGVRFHKAKPWTEPEPEIINPPVDKDSDGDGIFDSKDQCPTVPGVAKYFGCPVPDTDGDGVADDKDKCPEMPGYPELDGCPYPDRDKDGVTDNKDRCPDVPGSTKNDGCPITDRDGDGVSDEIDRCPDVAGSASNQGCPQVNEEVIKKTAEIAKKIYFEFNSSKIQTASYGPLSELVQILSDHPDYKLSIEGHTDNLGPNSYNQMLSESRVRSVKAYLINKGIDASRLSTIGHGEERPIADNKTSEGRALNRRVELKVSN